MDNVFIDPISDAANFRSNLNSSPRNGDSTPTTETRDLGWMLYDLDYSGKEPMPQFFHATMEKVAKST